MVRPSLRSCPLVRQHACQVKNKYTFVGSDVRSHQPSGPRCVRALSKPPVAVLTVQEESAHGQTMPSGLVPGAATHSARVTNKAGPHHRAAAPKPNVADGQNCMRLLHAAPHPAAAAPPLLHWLAGFARHVSGQPRLKASFNAAVWLTSLIEHHRRSKFVGTAAPMARCLAVQRQCWAAIHARLQYPGSAVCWQDAVQRPSSPARALPERCRFKRPAQHSGD